MNSNSLKRKIIQMVARNRPDEAINSLKNANLKLFSTADRISLISCLSRVQNPSTVGLITQLSDPILHPQQQQQQQQQQIAKTGGTSNNSKTNGGVGRGKDPFLVLAIARGLLTNDQKEQGARQISLLESLPNVDRQTLEKGYYAMLRAHSRHRDRKGLEDVMRRMSERDIRPSPQSYRWMFACCTSSDEMQKLFDRVCSFDRSQGGGSSSEVVEGVTDSGGRFKGEGGGGGEKDVNMRELYNALVIASVPVDIRFALDVFDRMRNEGYKPDTTAYQNLIRYASCAHGRRVPMDRCEELLQEWRQSSMANVPMETVGNMLFGYMVRNDLDNARTYAEYLVRNLQVLSLPSSHLGSHAAKDAVKGEKAETMTSAEGEELYIPKFSVFEAMLLYFGDQKNKSFDEAMTKKIVEFIRKNDIRIPPSAAKILKKSLDRDLFEFNNNKS